MKEDKYTAKFLNLELIMSSIVAPDLPAALASADNSLNCAFIASSSLREA